MELFDRQGASVRWRGNGETVTVTAWGKDGLRVQSTLLHSALPRFEGALLPSGGGEPLIRISGDRAVIQNGNILCELWVQDYEMIDVPDWERPVHLTFRDGSGKLLLREIRNGGAL